MLRVSRALPASVSTISRAPPNFARRPRGTLPPEDEWHCLTPVPVPPRADDTTLMLPRLRPRRSIAMVVIAFVVVAVAVAIAIA